MNIALALPAKWKKYLMQLLLWAAIAAVSALGTRYLGTPSISTPVPAPPSLDHIAPEAAEPLYYCGRNESIRDELSTKPWPVKRITWTIDTSASPLPAAVVVDAFRQAWNGWAEKLDIEPVYVETNSAAMVQSKFGDYDGSGKVLAWSELADGTLTVKHQLYDRAEKWEVAANPKQIDIVRVACHEIGHVLGLVHDDGRGNALMDPIYSRTIRFPTAQDVNRAMTLGYKPAKVGPPSPSPSPMPTISVQINAAEIVDALRRAGFKVEAPQ